MSDLGSITALRPGAARGLKLAACVATFNSAYTRRLLNSAHARLKALGGGLEAVEWVPGAPATVSVGFGPTDEYEG